MRFRALLAVAMLVIGLALAVLIAGLGPSRFILCGSGNFLDRLAHSVGRAFGGEMDACQAPTAGTWVASIGVGVLATVGAVYTLRRGHHIRSE